MARARKPARKGGKRSRKAKFPKYKMQIKDCGGCIIDGTLLAIDPSTGSESSLPGYAVFQNGQLVESGVITLDLAGNRAQRLYEINRTIREDFSQYKFDAIAVEDIGYFMGKMNARAVVSLQRAVGAIIAAYPTECLIEVPSNAWQKHRFKGYVKGDEQDAICIGLCVINTAISMRVAA